MAAILVLVRHTTQYWNFGICGSYLSVGLFFLLSGFVIAFAYEEKLRSGALSFQSFVKIRLIRLYPMCLLSLLIATTVALVFIDDVHKPMGGILVSALLALVFMPSKMDRSMLLYFLNIPYWSLFFELVVNLFYAAACPFLRTRRLVLVVCCAGVVLALGAARCAGLDSDFLWGVTPLVVGLSRASYCILLGCLLFRCMSLLEKRLGWYLKHAAVPWLACISMVGVLLLPNAGRFNGVLDFALVPVVFPVLVVLAARGDGGRLQNVLLILGSASYPIYVLHEPVAKGFALLMPELVAQHEPWSGIAYTVLLVALALWLEKKYDLPLRRWLSGRKSVAVQTQVSTKAG